MVRSTANRSVDGGSATGCRSSVSTHAWSRTGRPTRRGTTSPVGATRPATPARPPIPPGTSPGPAQAAQPAGQHEWPAGRSALAGRWVRRVVSVVATACSAQFAAARARRSRSSASARSAPDHEALRSIGASARPWCGSGWSRTAGRGSPTAPKVAVPSHAPQSRRRQRTVPSTRSASQLGASRSGSQDGSGSPVVRWPRMTFP